MKTKLFKSSIFFGLFMCLVIQSCDLEKLPLDGPSAGTFPADENEAILGLLGAYQSIPTLDAASTPIWHVMDNITDVGYTRPSNNYTGPITSSVTADNALAIKPWRYHYRTIARVHSVLDNLDKLQDDISNDLYLQIQGELRFIRGYIYSQLIEIYGGVPLLKNAVGISDSDVPRSTVEDVRGFIISEMQEIADNLPIVQSLSYGRSRASRIAALMLLSRQALYDRQYGLAAESAKKAIDLSEGVHDLIPFNESINYAGLDHSAGEPDPSSVFGHDGYDNGLEWIWVAEYNQAAGLAHNQQYYGASRLANGAAYWGPTQNFIDSFQDSEGNPIDKSNIYDASKPFENRDPRLDMYCVRPHSRFMGFQFEPNQAFPSVLNYWPVINGNADSPSTITNNDATNAYRSFSGYLWRKHYDIADYPKTAVSGKSELNVGILRYAELLLLYAEAKIENNDIDQSVYSAINQVRNRAHMPDLPSNLSQNELRTALRYERKIELANDGLRWYDIRRWGIANDIMNGKLYLNRSANDWVSDVILRIDENYSPIYNESVAEKYFGTQEIIFKENKDEYWPIPIAEIDANPNLVQNPGY